jgi:MYXO-CTERM domain-containing protein
MCHSDADCRAPLAHCDLSTGTEGHCVQCLFDTDCDAPLVCDPTKKKCLECAPGDMTQCKPELTGAQCLTDGRCGCLADNDCGGQTSGRVCDATTSRCVPGCRGMDGNGCPSQQICSSPTAEIGRCDQAPTDGGAGDASDASIDGPTSDGGADGKDGGGVDAAEAGGADTREAGIADASAEPHDGAPPADATADATPADAGGAADAADAGATGAGLDRFIAGGGCHCATAREDSRPGWLALLFVVGIAACRRRRR